MLNFDPDARWRRQRTSGFRLGPVEIPDLDNWGACKRVIFLQDFAEQINMMLSLICSWSSWLWESSRRPP